MTFSVNEFRSRLQGGGARPNMFRVVISSPPFATGLDSREMSFLVKASSFPESTVGVIDVPYHGRTLKFAGDREFPDWNTTVINDEDFSLRDALERWQSAIAKFGTNEDSQRGNGANSNPFSYVSDARIEQLSKDGKVIKTEKILNCWPTNIGPIELSYENSNAIEEFEVTWALDGIESNSKL